MSSLRQCIGKLWQLPEPANSDDDDIENDDVDIDDWTWTACLCRSGPLPHCFQPSLQSRSFHAHLIHSNLGHDDDYMLNSLLVISLSYQWFCSTKVKNPTLNSSIWRKANGSNSGTDDCLQSPFSLNLCHVYVGYLLCFFISLYKYICIL